MRRAKTLLMLALAILAAAATFAAGMAARWIYEEMLRQ